MRLTFLLLLGLASYHTCLAQNSIPLYQGAVPNNHPLEKDPESMVDRPGGGRAFFDTAVPTLTIYQPPSPSGRAIIVCPGGGYVKTAFDKEGSWVAERLLADSITVFVLKYRIPQAKVNINPSLAPLQDAQEAIRHVRTHASAYGLNPNQIGIMGFSAGGHLAASAATHFTSPAQSDLSDTTSVRPDFAMLIYPVISFTDSLTHLGSRTQLLGPSPDKAAIQQWSSEQQVSASTPPTFLVHAADDQSVKVENSIAFYQACLAAGVSAEMHLYARGGHGFGMYNKTTADDWVERLINWLRTL